MTHPDKAMVERVLNNLIDDEAKALTIIDTAFGEAGCKRPFFGEAYEPGTVVASIYRQLAALTAIPNPQRWMPIETAPKDGTHFLACGGNYSPHWGFNQSPPMVVHYFPDPEEPGFYLSSGVVQGSYNDVPQTPAYWKPLGSPPVQETE